MPDITINDTSPDITKDNKIKVIALYKFIRDLCALKSHIITDIENQNWTYFIKDIPVDQENIKLFYRDRIEEEVISDDTILEVKKPEFQQCPMPPDEIVNWLIHGWEKYRNTAGYKETLTGESVPEAATVTITPKEEHFKDSNDREGQYNEWIVLRNDWAEKQRKIDKIRIFFNQLYQIHTDLERDSETLELMVGNGIIKDKSDTQINHPILLKRVKITFDAERNIIYVKDTDTEAELYTMLLQEIVNINHEVIKQFTDELHESDYHPLDRQEAYKYLKHLIRRLCAEGRYNEPDQETVFGATDRLILTINPVLFMRKRVDGSLKAVTEIINHIEKTGHIPSHIIDLVAPGTVDIPKDNHEPSIDEQLAASSGEDPEILLPKEANREQLEIAQRIEKYNAVLVQGPPGTGKTHTIANLLSHFLAQGKTVLVTSQTKKALSVLKEKIPEGIQNLCVSVLDDSNHDMERSVDGISGYLSKYTSNELKNRSEASARKRKEVMERQAEVRKRIFSIKYKEFKPIVYNGDSYSPAEAATFISANAEELSSIIPGKVELYHPLPATFEELSELYRSNECITKDDEYELDCGLPDPSSLIQPSTFENGVKEFENTVLVLNNASNTFCGKIKYNYTDKSITLTSQNKTFIIVKNTDCCQITELEEYINSFNLIKGWMVYAATDGKKGEGYKTRWETMIAAIDETVKHNNSLVADTIGKRIKIIDNADLTMLVTELQKMEDIYKRKNKITFIDRIQNKQFKIVENSVLISDVPVIGLENCIIAIKQVQLLKMRNTISVYWDELMVPYGVSKFFDLNEQEPERIAFNMIPIMQRCLAWYSDEYTTLINLLLNAGINSEFIFTSDNLDSDAVVTTKIFLNIKNFIPLYIQLIKQYKAADYYNNLFNQTVLELSQENRSNSDICNSLLRAIQNDDIIKYNSLYQTYENLYDKYKLREIRNSLLKKLHVYAPDWAYDIQNRIGIHGDITVSSKIEDAWKWKQLAGIIDDITKEPFEELQKQNALLSVSYRKITAELAEYSAWYHLLLKTENNLDMRRALQGWRLTVQRIGRGFGINVPMLRFEAKKLMSKCQEAVPAWIMPVNKAMESLNPAVNKFDVIIVDEASQSDISALAIIYMAKKIIIVGDDKQVSPMAIGTDINGINALAEMYIKNVIPNWQLYNAKSSLYDIAITTFQPLMLREHFRCVPDIIGFSNKLSYDYKIKPLRDTSNCKLLPAVVNYRVDVGQRDGKINCKEAETIMSLLMACLEQDEYADKTFGIISLLGDEQVKKIQSFVFEKLEPSIIEKHRILCGNASHFQGDERDVIFMSMVDSNNSEGPLDLLNKDPDQPTTKRYNVAASRAKDQMWVIHSLDSSRDLKPGDLRKELIDYAINPSAYSELIATVEVISESLFEEAVGKTLVARGYKLVQQWKVGAYRIDMVVVSGNKKIAIECDGDQFHSGEDKIREDMERQTILERLGWKFIRIRGSEYYRNPEKTIERIVIRLEENDIKPANPTATLQETPTSELLSRVKIRSMRIIDEWKKDVDNIVNTAIDATEKENDEIKTSEAYNQLKSKQQLSTLKNKEESEKPEKEFIQQTLFKETSQKGAKYLAENIKFNKKSSTTQSIHVSAKTDNKTTRTKIRQQKQPVIENTQQMTNIKAAQNVNTDIDKEVIRILKETNVEFIDNSEQSSLIWVLYSESNKLVIQRINEELHLNCVLERRGSKATNNNPAWLIMIRREI